MINNIHVYPGVGEYTAVYTSRSEPMYNIVILIFNEYNWNINIKSEFDLLWVYV